MCGGKGEEVKCASKVTGTQLRMLRVEPQVDLRGMEISGKELQNRCDEVYITLNKNTVPNDPRSPFVTSGVRIGTPAITSRGLVESDMEEIAHLIWLTATDFENKADEIRAAVTKTNSVSIISRLQNRLLAFSWWGAGSFPPVSLSLKPSRQITNYELRITNCQLREPYGSPLYIK